jgi:serine/threonine protein kinase KIN1/2
VPAQRFALVGCLLGHFSTHRIKAAATTPPHPIKRQQPEARAERLLHAQLSHPWRALSLQSGPRLASALGGNCQLRSPLTMSTPATSEYPHPSHHSGHHAQHTHDQPSRSLSTRSRPSQSAAASGPQRSASHNHHGHGRPPPAGRPVQDVLPQRDYETTHVASKRSSSRERHAARGAGADSKGVDSKGVHRRTSTRLTNPPPGDLVNPTAVAKESNNTSPSSAIPPVMQAAADARAIGAKTRTTRTSIPTQSGKWNLGKTIGAGSMGKVKLARKEDGSEQVSDLEHHSPVSSLPHTRQVTRSCPEIPVFCFRLPVRLSRAVPRTRITTTVPRRSEQTSPRRSVLPERQPS